ncbi:hypothetical protein F5Y04DRAFT_290102 [Hypomontagnella monticulosa]|nr:hypothetical protein F5Y04DRAFT_290102 [Hypomontagnella monticulosa]
MPSPRDWEKYRPRIEQLYITLGYQLEGADGVMETMAKQGFTATREQYHYKFRTWKLRKRKSQAESSLQQVQLQHSHVPNHRVGSAFLVSHRSDDITRAEGIHASELACHWNTSPTETTIAATAVALSTDNLYPWLRRLPTTELVTMTIKSIYNQSPANASSGSLTNTSDSNLLHNLNAAMSDLIRDRWRRPQIPQNLFSLRAFAGENWSQFGALSDEGVLAARFDGRLLAAITNGFACLSDMTAADVMKLLNRHPATQSVVVHFLSTSSGPMVKAFAENVFRAYIEADNVEVVEYFLNRRLVDANETVCHYNGERYTPLEIAAMLQSFRVIRFFINRQVDVNKTFRDIDHSNALHLLIDHVEFHRATLDDSFWSSVHDLLTAGAIIVMDAVMRALNLTDPNLAVFLIKKVASQEPQNLVSHDGLLKSIVGNLREREAKEIFELIIYKCLQLGRVKDLHSSDNVSEALVEAECRKFDELAEVLRPHACGPRVVVQKAMDTGNWLIFDSNQRTYLGMVENLRPNGDTECERTSIRVTSSRIRSNLYPLEERDTLNLRGHELGLALTKALEAGDLESATMLLNIDPDFKFYEGDHELRTSIHPRGAFSVSDALSAALAHGFDDIAWKLLALGLTTNHSYQDETVLLLNAAVQRNKPEFVRAILKFGFNRDILNAGFRDRWKVLERALESGENSIIDDLWDARPFPWSPSDDLLKCALRKGRKDLFFNFVKSVPWWNYKFWVNTALEVAVKCENESVLDDLISLGAAADNDKALELAVKHHFSMVNPLLYRFWKAYPQGRTGYGGDIVSEALSPPNRLPPNILSLGFTWDLIIMNAPSQAQGKFLHWAIKEHSCSTVKKFIDAGYNVNSCCAESSYTGNGYVRTTPLLDAIGTENLEKVQLLVDHGAKVNEPIRFGMRRTPLQKAAEVNSIPILNLLLEKGADVNATPSLFDGGTALQFAAIHGNCEMAAILINRGAVQDIPPPIGGRGRWPLEGAAEYGRFDMIELLWKAHKGPFDDAVCQSAMRRAERNGYIGCKEKIEELMAISSRCSTNEFPPTSQSAYHMQ